MGDIWIGRWGSPSGVGAGFDAPISCSHRVNEQLSRALTINIEIILQQAKNLPLGSLGLLDQRAD